MEPTTRNIAVYARVRPTSNPSDRLAWSTDDRSIRIHVPKDAASGLINNTRDEHVFHFDGVLGPDDPQDHGINGTVFAYGQTGSGKTFTMAGGARYADRGIIPRAIGLVFAEIAGRPDLAFTVHVTYLELYNEVGYDLLDDSRGGPGVPEPPRVAIMEDDQGGLHMRHVGMHRVTSEEETLHLVGDSTVRSSKLSLVDLAGSERVGKSSAEGHLLREARYINLSLHYLEQVIVALQDRGGPSTHVPYRNCLMTLVLRDSLGGNCATAMVATLHPGLAHLDETCSTCRFAQRVAHVSNTVHVNEATDPLVLVAQLRQENRDLRAQLALLRAGTAGGTRQEGGCDLQVVEQAVDSFLDDSSPTAADDLGAALGGMPGGLAQGLVVLKQKVVDSLRPQVDATAEAAALQARVAELEAVLAETEAQLRQERGTPATATSASSAITHTEGSMPHDPQQARALLQDTHAAVAAFRMQCPLVDVIEENKAQLRAHHDTAKRAAAAAANTKTRLQQLQQDLQRVHVRLHLHPAGNPDEEAESARVQVALQQEHTAYRTHVATLRDSKRQVKTLQAVLERNRAELQQRFQAWRQHLQGVADKGVESHRLRSVSEGSGEGEARSSSTFSALASTSSGASSLWDNRAAPQEAPVVGSPSPPLDPALEGLPSDLLEQVQLLLTGDADIDRDIVRFYRARHALGAP